jgi:hypothetical protein
MQKIARAAPLESSSLMASASIPALLDMLTKESFVSLVQEDAQHVLQILLNVLRARRAFSNTAKFAAPLVQALPSAILLSIASTSAPLASDLMTASLVSLVITPAIHAPATSLETVLSAVTPLCCCSTESV